MKPLKR